MNVTQSAFRDPQKDAASLARWVERLEEANGYAYECITVQTSLGKTQVWALHTEHASREPLVIFPGFRTTALFWDLDQGLQHLEDRFRIYMVETNGQPNLSDGYAPAIRTLDYGRWAGEVLAQLNLKQAYIAGASFGGLVCMKLCLAHPEKVKAAVLLNPACFRFISLAWKNLYANLLPVLMPSRKHVAYFLNTVIFCKPDHQVSPQAEALITDYLMLALRQHKGKSQKPYNMRNELRGVQTDVYLVVGDQDILFPYETTIRNARTYLGDHLKDVVVLENVGHGIETSRRAIQEVGRLLGPR